MTTLTDDAKDRMIRELAEAADAAPIMIDEKNRRHLVDTARQLLAALGSDKVTERERVAVLARELAQIFLIFAEGAPSP